MMSRKAIASAAYFSIGSSWSRGYAASSSSKVHQSSYISTLSELLPSRAIAATMESPYLKFSDR